ncbi:MAG: ribosome biogenesis GTP-binding protein YihA/YsxC [Actinomycetota bacterium]|nr:ribosome biogenesis GTP-binding protein YihA/YsxC [Actinomycetota bacterium]
MSSPIPLRFVTSADDHHKLPDTAAELAVVGRSNVGKSSLINAVANRNGLAHVSKTPGRTRLLNLFAIGKDEGPDVGIDTAVVDLPGYGYAAAPKREQARWQAMIEGYLLERETLATVIVLVDGEVGPTKLDVQMLDWLAECDVPYVVVATKADKVKASKRQKRREELARKCALPRGEITWVSAAKGTGIDELRAKIYRWLAPA